MLWIVGKVFADYQEYLERHAIPYGIFADVHKPITAPAATAIINLNLSSEEAVVESFESLSHKPQVTALITAGYEQYVLPAAWIAKHLGLPGPSLGSARAATNKTIMRKLFADAYPEITPASEPVQGWHDIEKFMASHSFPVMLKPTNLMKSLYVTKSDDLKILRANYDQMTRELPKMQEKMGLAEEPGILIEEFMSGSMHTVAGFVDNTGTVHFAPGIADCVTAQNIGVDDNFLFCRVLPTSLGEPEQQRLLDASRKGVEALGLTNSPLHIEIILTPQGPKIIEIGARIGGYRGRMYAYADGIDMYQASIAIARGHEPNLQALFHKSCAFIEVFPHKQGQLVGIQHETELTHRPSVLAVNRKRKAGEPVGPAKAGFRAVEVIMLGHDDPAVVQADIDFIRDKILVEVD